MFVGGPKSKSLWPHVPPILVNAIMDQEHSESTFPPILLYVYLRYFFHLLVFYNYASLNSSVFSD